MDLGLLKRIHLTMQETQEKSSPGSVRSPGEGNGYPLLYFCLENSMDRGAWRPWGHKQSDMTEATEHAHADP